MVKPTGWVVDMRHYIDEDTGDLPALIPERVLSLAIFFGAIVAWVTDHLPDGDEHTNVPCRRSVNGGVGRRSRAHLTQLRCFLTERDSLLPGIWAVALFRRIPQGRELVLP